MKIYFYTSGCRVNQYETQVLREQFFAKGNESRENISKCSGRYSYNDFAKFLSSRISNIENEPELYSSILKEEVLK